MQFYSTNGQSRQASLEEAVMTGLAPDGGLYMPERIPIIPRAFFNNIGEMSITDISFVVANMLLGEDIDAAELKQIVYDTFSFDIPLKKISDRIYSLELFHGPTSAFKDVGARFLARIISHYSKSTESDVNVLVATSGDSGGAVASGFHNVPGVKVFVLYPERGLTHLQRHQFSSLGDNVYPIEVMGNFDECQRLVKEAFVDKDLRERLSVTSANSINICRLLPQMFYYFYAYSRYLQMDPKGYETDIVISVPCGNLGNLTAGLLAKKMGLPVKRFVAANNLNDSFTRYLDSGNFAPCSQHPTIACAMDVGNPSNISRIIDLYARDHTAINNDIHGRSFTDGQIAQCMSDTFRTFGYLMDPHTATALMALSDDLSQQESGIFLATAHPAKYNKTVMDVTGTSATPPINPTNEAAPTRHDTPKITPSLPALKKVLLTST